MSNYRQQENGTNTAIRYRSDFFLCLITNDNFDISDHFRAHRIQFPLLRSLLLLKLFLFLFSPLLLSTPHSPILSSISHPPREGLSPPLAYTPLSEAWSDHLFYFSTLSFKRSGNYTVSFIIEVTNTAFYNNLICVRELVNIQFATQQFTGFVGDRLH